MMLIRTSSAYLGRSGGSATRAAATRRRASLATTARPEEAFRPQQQDDHEQPEHHQLLERAGQERGPERLGQPHDEAAGEGAEKLPIAPNPTHHEGHDIE